MKPGFTVYLRRPTMTDPDVLSSWPLWPDCRFENATDNDEKCPSIAAEGSSRHSTFGWTGSVVRRDEYQFIPTVLLDAWETGARWLHAYERPEDGDAFARDFPHIVMGAFTMLSSDPSFHDLRDAILDEITAWYADTGAPASAASTARSAVEDAFRRHGVDADLAAYCEADATADRCH